MCNINIEKVVKIDNNNIVVSGTVSDCQVESIEGGQVSVEVSCGNNTLVEPAEVFADGRWHSVFFMNCQCDEQVRATAVCVSDINCNSTMTLNELPCIKCPEISIKVEETSDDVFKTLFKVDCIDECGNAHVSFEYTFTNEFDFPITVEVDPGPGGTPVSGTSEDFNPNDSRTVVVICKYPSPFIPQIFIRFLSNGELIGCPPIKAGGPLIEQCPTCQKELPNVQVSLDGCTATFSGDFVSPECTFIVNFDEAGATAVPQNSLNFTHTYAATGDYNVGIVMTCDCCEYPLAGINVEIEDCDGKITNPPEDPSNPWYCGPLRSLMAVSAGLALFFAIMIICLPAAWLAFLIAAGVSAVIGIIAGVFHSIFCPKKPCNFALLTTAQAALSAGAMLMIYSLCCPWVIWAGLVTIASGIGLMLLWKDKCNKSACQTATEVAYVFLILIPAITAILVAMVVLTPCRDPFWGASLGVIFSAITLYALGCDE